METLKRLVLRNRYTLLLTVILAYVGVIVIEGTLTGREARVFDLENPYFDINIDQEYLRSRANR
ncbi:MAG: hypothetical protein WDZ76_09930 [Pseudohongiellaceae bacterium]